MRNSVSPIVIQYNGALVALDHLDPLTFGCPCPEIERDIRIGVIFANHCYTEQFDATKHSENQIILREGDRGRVFCPIRHGLSVRLPEIITSLPDKKVHQTPEARNYVYAVPMEIEGQNYEVFFMLQKHKAADLDLRLTVESAYPVTGPPIVRKRPGAIRFRVLAYKTLRGEPVKFAPR